MFNPIIIRRRPCTANRAFVCRGYFVPARWPSAGDRLLLSSSLRSSAKYPPPRRGGFVPVSPASSCAAGGTDGVPAVPAPRSAAVPAGSGTHRPGGASGGVFGKPGAIGHGFLRRYRTGYPLRHLRGARLSYFCKTKSGMERWARSCVAVCGGRDTAVAGGWSPLSPGEAPEAI